MSTHNICFCTKIRKILFGYDLVPIAITIILMYTYVLNSFLFGMLQLSYIYFSDD